MHADVLRAINTQINAEFGAWYQYWPWPRFASVRTLRVPQPG